MPDEINVSINEQGQVQVFENEYGTFYLYNVDYLPNGKVHVEKAVQTARFHMNKLNKNNYIFSNKFPLKRILSDLSKENDKIGKKSLRK